MPAIARKKPPAFQAAAEAMADGQNLMRRAASFANHDAKYLLARARESVLLLGGAWAAMIVGGLLACFGIVHGLHVLVPEFPLWAWYAIAGGTILALSGFLLARARAKLAALETVQERAGIVANDAVHLAGQVNEVLMSSKESLESTVDSVKSAVESARQATNLSYQVQQRPCLMFAIATAVGYIGGSLLIAEAPRIRRMSALHSGNGKSAPESAGAAMERETGSASNNEPGFFAKLGEALAPQAELAREVAIGALFSLARDFALDAVAKPMAQPVDDFFNDAARKFGGRPLARGTFNSPAHAAAAAENDRPAS